MNVIGKKSKIERDPEYDVMSGGTDDLEDVCLKYLNIEPDIHDGVVSECDINLTDYILENAYRNSEGRLVMPALWNDTVVDRLPNNYKLASNILQTSLKKLKNEPSKLLQYDDVIKKQIEAGVLEKVDDIEYVKNNKNYSFLAHNAVFRENKLTTKCRVVLLSNLCERGNGTNLSHNQISMPGPQLNAKLTIALTLLRFNKYLFIYDLEKAYLQLGLRDCDSDKLLILWAQDVARGNFKHVSYKFKRVPFGMRFSPTLLMVALYIIFVLHASNLTEKSAKIRKMMYNLTYMDNVGFSANNEQEILEGYEDSKGLLNSFGFNLQQYNSNSGTVKNYLNIDDSDATNLMGLLWDTKKDYLSNKPIQLNSEARTKREVLSALNSRFDPLGIFLPNMNRAKLFMQELQNDKKLAWDDVLGKDRLKAWKNIVTQINKGSELKIDRHVGDYSGEFSLICFTDCSKDIYGCVLYIRENSSGKMSFLLAKNRLINKNLKAKSIPVLELIAISFGVEQMINMRNELTAAVYPVNLTELFIFTDSMISLHWLSSKALKFTKIEKRGV